VTHFGRNGYYYQLDRTNGAFIGATQWVEQVTWTAGIDPKTGKPVEYDPSLDVQTYIPATRQRRADNPQVNFCPTMLGGVRWQPPAYNPERHIAFGAGGDGCTTVTIEVSEPVSPEGGNPKGVNQNFLGGSYQTPPMRGMIAAVDVTNGEIVKKVETAYHNLSGVLATAGGLIFTGELDGRVVAYNDETLEEVWDFNGGISFKAPPISYAIGDKQFIAILAGGESAPADGKPALDSMKEGAMLYVFSL
jgi:alcohol dehydrogenase (cytochrome c)